MTSFPPEVQIELDGWELQWVALEVTGASDETAQLWQLAHEQARHAFANAEITRHPRIHAVRQLLRQAGCDPTRYRPSSEALLRRVLKGDDLPRVHPLVDLNNLVSVRLVTPCCVVDPDALSPPLVLRAGRSDEEMRSLRGPFRLEGKPVLADQVGPFGTPITDSERVKITGDTGSAWMVAYLPAADEADMPRLVEALLKAASWPVGLAES